MSDKKSRSQRSGPEWIFNPTIASIDHSLRQEFRREIEALEEDVLDAELRERHLADVASDIRNKGNLVTVASSFRSFSGSITYAASDFMVIETQSFEVDISLDDVSHIRVHDERSHAGLPAHGGPGTLEMRLMEKRSASDKIEIGYRRRSETLPGRIVAVGQDHVVVLAEEDQEWIIPLNAISWVMRHRK